LHTRSLMLAHLLGNLYHKRATFERIGAAVLKDIADYITVGVVISIFRFIAHIRAHRFSTTESGTFADQQDDHIGFDQFTNIIHHTNACILYKERRTKRKTSLLYALFDDWKDLAQIRFNRCSGETIADDEL